MRSGVHGRARSVRLEGLAKRYGDVRAVEPLDLEVRRGELLVLLGPSGCGKTTVLRMIAGLEEPSAGHVYIGGERVDDVEPAARDIAMVFQSYSLYPHMKVRDNLAFGLKMRGLDRSEARRRVEEAARVLGLDPLLDRRPGQLSGGQKQRVALGRAMVREPSVFLFDEPLSNLDASLRLEMRGEIAELHRRLGATMVYVTHDQVEAMTLGRRIAVMKDGRLRQCAPPLEVYRRPADLFVARFVGTPAINTVAGELEAEGDGLRFRAPSVSVAVTPDAAPALPDPGAPGGGRRVVLGVRPEDLVLTGPGDAGDTGDVGDAGDVGAHLRTRVRRLEPLGSEVLVHLEGPGEEGWVARVGPDRDVGEGEAVGVRLAAGRFHLFDADGGRRLGPEEGGGPG